MANNKSGSSLSKIRAGVGIGVSEGLAEVKESAIKTIYDVPVFGTILKNINKEMKGGSTKPDQGSKATESMEKSLRNIEKSVIQISDNIYNIAAAVGAQLTSMKETEESIRQQREQAQRDKEASADARPVDVTMPDAKPVAETGKAAAGAGVATKLGSGIIGFLTNPYTLIAGLVAAIGYGVYKYFTDDGFKNTIDKMFQSVMDFDVMENIVKPLGDIFINIGAGLAKLSGMLMKWVADISIPMPDFAQKTLGLPAELKPFGFMKQAGEDLEGWADGIFKQRRDEKAAKKAAEEAARPPEAKASSGAPAGFGGAGPASGPATTWSQSVETAHAQAMPAPSASAGGLMGIAAKFIAQYEGLPAGGKAFWDPPGQRSLVSVGFGHQIQPNEYKQGFIQIGSEQVPIRGEQGIETVLTKEQAQALLAQDLPRYEKRAAAPLGEAWGKLNDNQKAALISYAYNTGSTATLVKNGLKDAILSGDMKGASQIISDKGVRTAGGQVVGGLVKRRAAEGALFASNAQPTTTAVATPASPPPAATPIVSAAAGSRVAQNDSSLSAPVKGEAPAATAQQPQPTTGSAISNMSADVSNLKLGSPESNIAIDNSTTNNSRMSSFLTGGIPTPVADRCSIDRFNFFEPIGNMKTA